MAIPPLPTILGSTPYSTGDLRAFASQGKTPKEVCATTPPLSSEAFHGCVSDYTLLIQAEIEQRSARQVFDELDRNLRMINQQTPITTSVWDAFTEFIFGVSERVNIQVGNWILLDASNKALEMYYVSSEDRAYLEKANAYLNQGLNHVQTSTNFDIVRNPLAILSGEDNKTIRPVDGYFELSITMLQVYNLQDPTSLRGHIARLRRELGDIRYLTAQAYDEISAQGHLNRLKMIEASLALSRMPEINIYTALALANEAIKWTEETISSNFMYLTLYGFNLKDLRYDNISARVLKGRLLMKMAQDAPDDKKYLYYNQARETFQAVLSDPVTTRKYGGFLDMGLQAFFGLVQIDLQSSRTVEEAAQKLDRDVKWNWLFSPEGEDFMEALNLMTREESLTSKVTASLNTRDIIDRESAPDKLARVIRDLKSIMGNISLYMNWPSWAPKDSEPVLSQLNIKTVDPKERLKRIMQYFHRVQFPSMQKREIFDAYRLVGGE